MAWGNGRQSYSGGNRSSSGGSKSNFKGRSGGGGNFKGRSGGRKQQQSDREFKNITGLFPSKSGNAHTVFVNEEIHEMLQSIQPGDMLCVSPRRDSDMLSLSVMLGEENQGSGNEDNEG